MLRSLRSSTARRLARPAIPSSFGTLSTTTPQDARSIEGLTQSKDFAHLGRSSVSGLRVTVFGANGCVGHVLVNRLGRIGSQVFVPVRFSTDRARRLKLMGDLGQIVPMKYQLTSKDDVLHALENSNVVVNLVGTQFETRRFSFWDVHVNAAEMIASCAAEAGVSHLIHVSSMGADVDSASDMYRTKAVGEQVVRNAFPSACIVRPAPIFGRNDLFTNRMRDWVIDYDVSAYFPHIERRISPVAVENVAEGIMKLLANPSAAQGRTFEFLGPHQYTVGELFQQCYKFTNQPNRLYEISEQRARRRRALSELGFMFFPMYLDQDEIIQWRYHLDAEGLPGLADLGVDLFHINGTSGGLLQKLLKASDHAPGDIGDLQNAQVRLRDAGPFGAPPSAIPWLDAQLQPTWDTASKWDHKTRGPKPPDWQWFDKNRELGSRVHSML